MMPQHIHRLPPTQRSPALPSYPILSHRHKTPPQHPQRTVPDPEGPGRARGWVAGSRQRCLWARPEEGGRRWVGGMGMRMGVTPVVEAVARGGVVSVGERGGALKPPNAIPTGRSTRTWRGLMRRRRVRAVEGTRLPTDGHGGRRGGGGGRAVRHGGPAAMRPSMNLPTLGTREGC